MSATIDVGYNMNIGDVELQYSLNDLLPSVSLLDYINDDSDTLYVGVLSAYDAAALLDSLNTDSVPDGWGWTKNKDEQAVYESDPTPPSTSAIG